MAEYWGFLPDEENAIFISYNSLDSGRVSEIALALHNAGLPVWYDYGLRADTAEWETQISKHIRQCRAIIIFVTMGIFAREDSYVMTEYKQAKGLGKVIIPVFLDNVTDSSFMRSWAARYAESYDKYANYLTKWKECQSVPYVPNRTVEETTAAIIDLLVRSDLAVWGASVSVPVPVSAPKPATVSEPEYKSAQVSEYKPKNLKKYLITATAILAAVAILWAAIAMTPGKVTTDNMTTKEIETVPTEIETVPTYLDTVYAVGDHLFFGSYEQDADESNGAEEIEWRVLEVSDDHMVLISEYILDCKPYNEEWADVTWETCTLRAWLNDEFYNTAFSSAERKNILTVRNENLENPYSGTNGGNDTEDRVYLLSTDETEQHFSDTESNLNGDLIYPDRMAKPTAYARQNGCYVNSDLDTGWWWLRSPGGSSRDAALVDSLGDIHDRGCCVSSDVDGVRPVVSVSL